MTQHTDIRERHRQLKELVDELTDRNGSAPPADTTRSAAVTTMGWLTDRMEEMLNFLDNPNPQPQGNESAQPFQFEKLEFLDHSPTIQFMNPREPTKSPTRPPGCTSECRHQIQGPIISYLVDAKTGYTRISFPDDHSPTLDVKTWYPKGEHTGATQRANLIRFYPGCRHLPCMTCEEDMGNPCTCDFRST